jgi:hypothetical protein
MKDEQQGILASGDLYMDFLDNNGESTGFQLVGNAKKFAPKVETETKENKLNGRDTLGQTADSFTRITSATLAITFNRYDPNILAAAFMGSAVEQDETAGPFAAEVTGIKGKWVDFGATGLETVTVQDAASLPLVAGEDYEANLRAGMIMVLTDDLDGKTLKIAATTAAKTGKKIKASTRPMINVAIRLDGKNNVNGQNILVDVFKAQLKTDTEFDFLAEDFPELSFTGTMLTPPGKTWPFEIQ